MRRVLKVILRVAVASAIGLVVGIGAGCGDSLESTKRAKAKRAQKARSGQQAPARGSRFAITIDGIEFREDQTEALDQIKLAADARRAELDSLRERMKEARSKGDVKAQKEVNQEINQLRNRSDLLGRLRELLDEEQAQVFDANLKAWEERNVPARGRAG